MTFVMDDAFLPATLSAHAMSDEQFSALCAEHPDRYFEMSAEGELIVMPPTHSDTSASNSGVGSQLGVWASKDRRGIVCDSSGDSYSLTVAAALPMRPGP